MTLWQWHYCYGHPRDDDGRLQRGPVIVDERKLFWRKLRRNGFSEREIAARWKAKQQGNEGARRG